VRLAFIKLPDWYVISQLIEALDGRHQRKDGTALMADAVEDKPLGSGARIDGFQLQDEYLLQIAAEATAGHN
jgi:hypothetical protein